MLPEHFSDSRVVWKVREFSSTLSRSPCFHTEVPSSSRAAMQISGLTKCCRLLADDKLHFVDCFLELIAELVPGG